MEGILQQFQNASRFLWIFFKKWFFRFSRLWKTMNWWTLSFSTLASQNTKSRK
jgi:hypothetical protein